MFILANESHALFLLYKKFTLFLIRESVLLFLILYVHSSIIYSLISYLNFSDSISSNLKVLYLTTGPSMKKMVQLSLLRLISSLLPSISFLAYKSYKDSIYSRISLRSFLNFSII